MQKARELIDSSSKDVLTTVRANGDKIFYNTKTNEFAVLSKDGLIRTFFKPTTGMVYFMDSEDPYEEIQMPML